jgi:hypothetical protein
MQPKIIIVVRMNGDRAIYLSSKTKKSPVLPRLLKVIPAEEKNVQNNGVHVDVSG